MLKSSNRRKRRRRRWSRELSCSLSSSQSLLSNSKPLRRVKTPSQSSAPTSRPESVKKAKDASILTIWESRENPQRLTFTLTLVTAMGNPQSVLISSVPISSMPWRRVSMVGFGTAPTEKSASIPMPCRKATCLSVRRRNWKRL